MSKLPEHITEARTATLIQQPFFGSLLFERSRLALTDADGTWRGIPVPIAMTDGYHIVVRPDRFASYTTQNNIFVFAHELVHVFMRHPARFKFYQDNGLFGHPFDPKLANICADITINKMLRDNRIGDQVPGTLDMTQEIYQRFNYTVTGLEAWEDIYKLFVDEAESGGCSKGDQMDDPGGDMVGSGSGEGEGDGLAGDVGDPSTADGNTPSEAEMKAAVKAAAAAAKSRGELPAGLKTFVDQFTDPVVDWKEMLAMEAQTTLGNDHYSYTRPHRRMIVMPGCYAPRRVGQACGPVAVAVDTSGSMSDRDLQAALAETAGILGDLNPELVYVIWCDAQVDRVDELESPEELLELTREKGVPGRGGTSFAPPFQWVIDNDIQIDAMIYMTDGIAPEVPDDLVDITDTIWCIIGQPGARDRANGRTIHIPSIT